ncbi:MAG: nucleotidyltransferase family protein [Trueperaceae bacterium]|nr:nucleotidyltransferase family protein [Trueperaceae bacterium]
MMLNWTQTFVSPQSSLRDVLMTIDRAELQIALVVDEKMRLLGLITDGDVRRALLKGMTLEAHASDIMTRDPVSVSPEMRPQAIEQLMQQKDIHHIPVLDKDGVIISLAVRGKILPRERFDNEVILMAGGLGSRLGDLTKDVPKPLLHIANKPILEIILDSFLEQGFHQFHIAVNYKAELIEHHFGKGRQWGAQINYLRENKRMGTCGALSLLKRRPDKPVIVMNGDLLTRLNFKNLLDFHSESGSMATMAVREYDVQIPFGVISTEGTAIKTISEKPVQRYFVNAGIYVLNPECFDRIPQDQFYDMTALFQSLLAEGLKVGHYPIEGYWIDIGQVSDFQQAKLDFNEIWYKPFEVKP